MPAVSPATHTAPSVRPLTPGQLAAALSVPDLTDPAQGPHALQLLVADLAAALGSAWGCEVRIERSTPLVSVEDNYTRLGYPADAVTRDARYTRYAGEGCMLRSHTSAMIPPALRRLAAEGLGAGTGRDVLLCCPGLVHRRDAVDRLHTGTPHQVDLWRLAERAGPPLGEPDLAEMIALVVAAALPGARWRTVPATHPYTTLGRQVDVLRDGEWVEIGECGLAAGHVLAAAGLDPGRVGGLAMGVGLDRLLMLRKGIEDIRLLRADDPRIAGQLADLTPYRPVSHHPPVRRDLSLAVAGPADAETLGDRVREALGEDADVVEEVAVVSETPGTELPPAAAARLGLLPGQKNVLLRIVLRHPAATLTDAEANLLRDRIWAALHEGTEQSWTAG
jgi:phenylalanyl-tRNA synthetase alpha chain